MSSEKVNYAETLKNEKIVWQKYFEAYNRVTAV
jgi:hypothetical protein